MIRFLILVQTLLVAPAVFAQPSNAAAMDTPISRQMLHSTVHIEVANADGTFGLGTGFFYSFPGPTTNLSYPVIATCWHVVSNANSGKLFLAVVSTNGVAREQCIYLFEKPPFKEFWIRHPDTNVDLAVLPLGKVLEELHGMAVKLDKVTLRGEDIARKTDMDNFGVFQEVKFVGYPIGLWDSVNHLPIIRRGMTASDPAVDYNGLSVFLIDAAVFPGSSGSPVLVADDASNPAPFGFKTSGRVKFLGVLYALNQYSTTGDVEIVTIPSAFNIKVKTAIPINLGLVIRADRLEDFIPLIRKVAGGGP